MFWSAARSKPSAESVCRHTSVARSFVYVASSGDSRRTYLALEPHACGQLGVLELVVALRELGGHEAALTCLAQPVEPLSPLAVAPVLLLAQRVELLAAEEVGVARDDRRLLRDLLLPHANGAPFLGALVQVPLELFLELRGAADRSR